MISISRYTPNFSAEWDALVQEARNATFLHRRAYMDYHSDRFSDYSLMARDGDGCLISVLPANRVGDEVISHGGLTYGAWLMPTKRCDAVVMLEVMEQALAFMKADGVKTLRYKAVPNIYHSTPADEDIYALFRCGARLVECNISSAIRLSDVTPFDRGNKAAVNKAKREGIIVETDSDEWKAYWQLLNEVLRERHNTQAVHSLDEIMLLHNRFPEEITLNVATRNGEMLAGVVLFNTLNVAHCQYIASSTTGRELKALPLLFRHMIDRAQDEGFRYFDFGISNEDHGQTLNSGLLQQKARLGGRGVAHQIFQIDL